MPVAVSVFGVGAPDGEAVFCYAQLRSLRTVGRYPPPSLPSAAVDRRLFRIRPEQGGFELQVWDAILGDEEGNQAEVDLKRGVLRLPDRCPIEPGATLTGVVFAETLLLETYGRVSVEGAGALQTRGFALEGGAVRVIAALQAALGRKEVGEELNALITQLDREAGLQGLMATTRRLGVVEQLTRQRSDADGSPIVVAIIKPDVRGSDPCREVVLTRNPGGRALDLRVSLQLKAWDAVILHCLVAMPAEKNEVRVDAGSHFTSILVGVFDEGTGELIDQQELSFIQRIGINLVTQGALDILPPPFRAAPKSVDLDERRRIITGAFSIGGGRDRAGGFDVMQRNAAAFDLLAGPRAWKAVTRFFPSGLEPQLDVIRWIKQCIEDTDVVEAFLIDPYLGTEALKRVVLRHGNESIKLTIVVSPANVDPDASTMDVACAPGQHVADLVRAADAIADELCGEIEIIHVQRGGGTQQAFHDRYLGLIGRDRRPHVFLLSNSLSKAAGDWPFTVAEIDTPTSWRIAAYVAAVTDGSDGSGKQLQATPVWRSTDASSRPPPASPAESDAFASALWSTYTQLFELSHVGGLEDRSRADSIVDRLVLALPESFNDQELAEVLVEQMNGRDHLALAVFRRLSDIPRLAPVAALMEEFVLQRLFDRVAPKSGAPFGFGEPLALLRQAGETLSRRPKGTDLVRNRMNPAIDAYARSLEIGRAMEDQIQRLVAGMDLVVVGLHLVRAGKGVPTNFRIGIATDYVHLLGRLLRSLASRNRFEEKMEDAGTLGQDHAREAVRLARELASDPVLKLASVADLMFSDPLIPPGLLT